MKHITKKNKGRTRLFRKKITKHRKRHGRSMKKGTKRGKRIGGSGTKRTNDQTGESDDVNKVARYSNSSSSSSSSSSSTPVSEIYNPPVKEMYKPFREMYNKKPGVNAETYQEWEGKWKKGDENDENNMGEMVMEDTDDLFASKIKKIKLAKPLLEGYDKAVKTKHEDPILSNFERQCYTDCKGNMDDVAQMILLAIMKKFSDLYHRGYLSVYKDEEHKPLRFSDATNYSDSDNSDNLSVNSFDSNNSN
jgi:hypothetical protein